MDSTDSVGTIVARIEEEVPSVLAATNTPGASIALIHDRACVWTGGFGVTNSETRKPVKPHNVFEAYSLTKPLLVQPLVYRVANRHSQHLSRRYQYE